MISDWRLDTLLAFGTLVESHTRNTLWRHVPPGLLLQPVVRLIELRIRETRNLHGDVVLENLPDRRGCLRPPDYGPVVERFVQCPGSGDRQRTIEYHSLAGCRHQGDRGSLTATQARQPQWFMVATLPQLAGIAGACCSEATLDAGKGPFS